ncbi:hypothetical protein ABZ858_12415 [Streptomyces sp. NPDC047017]|uniref:hypothetical protein n=1 Tax=Streptomyces sp. NPDC047017 TaxID=3155024 RepID=UPI0033E8D0D4
MPTCLVVCESTTPSRPPGRSLPEERHRSTILYEDVVRPACEQLGLTFLRADKLTEAGLPREQLLRMLTEVEVVIAELGGSDAELSFGLGVRHALGRCTVHVTEGSDQSPASGTTHRLPFPSHPGGAVTARQQLAKVLAAEALCGDSAPSLPAELTARTTTETMAEGTAGAEDGPGLFDLVVEAEAQLEALSGDMADVEAAVTDLGEMMKLIGEDMDRVSHPGASMSMKAAVLNRLAKAIDGPADELAAAAERFAERMGASFTAFRVFLEWAGNTPRSEWPEGAEELLDQVAMGPWEVQATAASFQEGMALINLLGTASRHLRRPARRITTSFETIFRSVSVLEELQRMAVALKKS